MWAHLDVLMWHARLEPLVLAGAERRRPVFAAYAKGGRRLHVGLQEFGEDVSAAMSAGAAKASSALFSGISSLKLGASFVANAVTIKRVDPRETEGADGLLTLHPAVAHSARTSIGEGRPCSEYRDWSPACASRSITFSNAPDNES